MFERKLSPALVLFFLAPAIGELLSGSAPPAEFFNPFTVLLLGLLYGGGAILVRELTLGWKKGWASLVVLGLAYGIIEEGLMVKSFFDPHWMDLDLLGTYGRWGGVNWIWSLELTIYHSVFSIAIPILLVELLFPQQRRESWVGQRGRIWLAVLFWADVAFAYFFLTTYRPPALLYLSAVLCVTLLVWLAWGLPECLPGPAPVTYLPGPWRTALLGFGATAAFFIIFWVLPNLNFPVWLDAAAGIGLGGAAGFLIGKLSNSPGWSDLHRLALAWGALSFFILLAPLQELDQTRIDDTTGMTLVALAGLALLFWIRQAIRHRSRTMLSQPIPENG